SSLIGVSGQRLVRTLRPHCPTWHEADACEQNRCEHIEHPQDLRLPQPQGCERCGHAGLRGRTALYEIVPVDDHMRRLVHGNAAEYEIENYARQQSGSIRDDGLRKVLAGKTTIEEVLRVTNEAAE